MPNDPVDNPQDQETVTPDPPEKPEVLGDAGKKALDAERSARREAEKKVGTLEQQITAINRALGLADGDDADKLAGQLEAVKSENRRLKVSQRVAAAATAAGADPELTWAHLFARGEVDDIDPGAEGFGEQVTALVAGAVREKPALRPTGSSGDGGPRGRPLDGGGGSMNDWIRHKAGH